MTPRHHTLTQRAERDLAELAEWSRARWGDDLTNRYLDDIYEASERLGESPRMFSSRSELATGSGLLVYPVREHYIVGYPIKDDHLIIVAYLRQGRDVSAILRKHAARIARELADVITQISSD